MGKFFALFLVILIAASAAASTGHVAGTPQANAGAPATGAARVQPATAGDPEADAMRADLARMRNIVGQMQRNLAFVDSGLTPLKHEFELEIEMWNLLINDMQRRLNARLAPPAAAPAAKPSPPPPR